MYVEDGKRTYRHIFIITFLIWYCLNVMLSMSKMLKIDQIHLRAVMLYYVKDVEDRSNTPKGCNAIYVEDVEDVKDRSNIPKGCNTMYVRDVEDGKRTYTHILVQYFLNI